MRTIYFDNKDIKESKIALVNRKITPLQSAFLMQYITNLEEQLQQKEDNINKAKEYISETKYSDIVGLNSYSIKDFWFIKDLLEILDSKGE